MSGGYRIIKPYSDYQVKWETGIYDSYVAGSFFDLDTKAHSVFLDFENSGIKFRPSLFNRTSLYLSKYIYSSS